MPHLLRAIVIFLIIAPLTGCSYLKTPKIPSLPGVHKFPIQQGNIVSQDMIDQLKPGMSRSQVRFVLGTPLLTDTFQQDRWDYWYSVKLPDGRILRERVAVYFTDDTLSGITGDYLPSSANQPVSDGAETVTPESSATTTKPDMATDALEAPVAVPIPEPIEFGEEDQSGILDQDH